MATDEQRIARILRRLSVREPTRADRANCPDEETLAVFLAGALQDQPKTDVEAHLAKCAACVEDLATAYQTGQETETDSVPQRLMEKVLALVPGKETLFELVVRLVKDSVELISTSARVMPLPVLSVRGATQPATGNVLQVEKEVGRFRIAVEIELVEPGTCQLIANVTGAEGKPVDGIRLSLNSEGREHASFLTRNGKVLFDRISPGEYSVTVSESGTHIGKIKLSLIL